MALEEPLLVMEGITKGFLGTQALKGVGFTLYPGEIVALMGENGAGKSTLMKILSGIYSAEGGRIILKGESIRFSGPKEAMMKGVGIIHQELNLIQDLSVAENIFLGREPLTKGARISWSALYSRSQALLDTLGVDLDPKTVVRALSMGEQQIVEILKALSLKADIFILDEPTEALTDQEAEGLFKVVTDLKAQGKGILYISHRIPEVFRLCDRVTVLRDGELVTEEPLEGLDENKLIRLMVGRELKEQIPYVPPLQGPPLLELRDFRSSVTGELSLQVLGGEVLGITGLLGSGRTELALSLLGIYPLKKGHILIEGKVVSITSPREALAQGIVYVSEDRKGKGLVLDLSVQENISLPVLRFFEKPFYKIDQRRLGEEVQSLTDKLCIKASSLDQRVRELSGGNQQKIALAKGLISQPRVLILDEPTRGVDVGAKKEIYGLINKLKEEGLGIIMISSEIPEILGISDRVLVMRKGKVAAELPRRETSQGKILQYAMGGVF